MATSSTDIFLGHPSFHQETSHQWQRTPPHGPRWQMPPRGPNHQSMNSVVDLPL
jgi:hypothetical protein